MICDELKTLIKNNENEQNNLHSKILKLRVQNTQLQKFLKNEEKK